MYINIYSQNKCIKNNEYVIITRWYVLCMLHIPLDDDLHFFMTLNHCDATKYVIN